MARSIGGKVEGGVHLRVGARVIGHDRVTTDSQCDGQPYRGSRGVVIEVVSKAVVAVRYRLDSGARPAFAPVKHHGHPGPDAGQAEAVDELADAPLGRAEGGDHGLEVTPIVLRRPCVGQDELKQRFIELPALIEFAGRDPQPFLLDIEGPRRNAGWHQAPYVGNIDKGPGITNELVAREQGPEEMHVGKMCGQASGAVGVVGDDNVARSERPGGGNGRAHV